MMQQPTPEQIQEQANDLIQAMAAQRNRMADEVAALHAQLFAAQRQIAAKDKEITDLKGRSAQT